MLDMEGQVLASTEKQPESLGAEVAAFITSPADSQVVHGYQFFKVFDENQLEYILLAKGSNDDVYMVGKMAAFQLGSLLTAYKAVSYTHLDVYKRQIEQRALCGRCQIHAGRIEHARFWWR